MRSCPPGPVGGSLRCGRATQSWMQLARRVKSRSPPGRRARESVLCRGCSGFILRSKAPELICQEIYALLTVYQALCVLEIHAAEQARIDPDRISFTVTCSSPG